MNITLRYILRFKGGNPQWECLYLRLSFWNKKLAVFLMALKFYFITLSRSLQTKFTCYAWRTYKPIKRSNILSLSLVHANKLIWSNPNTLCVQKRVWIYFISYFSNLIFNYLSKMFSRKSKRNFGRPNNSSEQLVKFWAQRRTRAFFVIGKPWNLILKLTI